MKYLILGNIAFAILCGIWWRIAGESSVRPAGIALIACGIAAGYLCGHLQASKQRRPAKSHRPTPEAANRSAEALLRMTD